MQPPAPPRFHRLLPATLTTANVLSQPVVMMLRNITGHPIRAFFTTLGMALSTAILIASLFLTGTMEELINVTYSDGRSTGRNDQLRRKTSAESRRGGCPPSGRSGR